MKRFLAKHLTHLHFNFNHTLASRTAQKQTGGKTFWVSRQQRATVISIRKHFKVRDIAVQQRQLGHLKQTS